MYIKCIKRRCGLKKNFYCGLAAFTALAFTACSDDSTANAVAQPVALDSSSSVLVGSSSSFVEGLSSSAIVESSSSAVVESSSSAVPGSSSSSFGLSSSDGVSSSSLAYSSSSLLFNSSSSSLAKSSASECWGLHWYGSDDEDGVRVPVETCAEFSWPKNVVADGAWRIMETDSVDGGKSSIVWPVEFSDGVDSMATVNEYCQGICGTAVLDKGSMTYHPFVSVGFTLARDSSGNPVPVDVSNWGGICIVYMSYVAPALELDLGDSINMKVLNGAVPTAGLPKSAFAHAIKCIPWSSFKIASWFKGDDYGWKEDTGVKAAKQLVGVRFRLQDKPQEGGYYFNVQSISAYNSGSGYAAGPADQ